LLAIGRLVAQKDYPLLLDALARISDRDWTIDILGDGPLLPQLQARAQALGIGERVRFRGFVPDAIPFLQSAHALVLSSAWEGQGAVLLEALACGCPVIATRSTDAVGAVLDEGRYGRLVAPGDPAALADAIARELAQRSTLPSSTSEWIGRYRIGAGIASHAGALDV
jgi:glycosyltransferase involved in cell wall biosynthesis